MELEFSDLVFLKYQELLGGNTQHRFPWLCPHPCLGQQDPPTEKENSSTVVFWDFLRRELLFTAAPGAAAVELRLQKAFWGMFPQIKGGGWSGRSCPSHGTHRSPGKIPQVWKLLQSREGGS